MARPTQPEPDLEITKTLQSRGYRRIVGLDEVGRGALAGPLLVAAVEIEDMISGVNDSKLLTPPQRQVLAEQIIRYAKQISFGYASNLEIDQLGMTAALGLAYQRALVNIVADFYLSDNFVLANRPHLRAVKGDRLFYQVAAASIIAKVTRDRHMLIYDRAFPHYGWGQNSGYGTALHRQAIKQYGASPLHRLSFINRGWTVDIPEKMR